MVVLNAEEADQLRERLRRVPSAQVAEGTITVSANASTSVTFTDTEKAAVLEVLSQWLNETGHENMGDGPLRLREALIGEF
jgi:hypothetical protein